MSLHMHRFNDPINNLIEGKFGDFNLTGWAVRVANPGKKEAQIVINLSYRSDCRPWIV